MEFTTYFKPTFHRLLACLSLGLSSMFFTACGPSSFVPSQVTTQQGPAGNMNIPPKIDILMGVSITGTMRNIYPALISEIPAFVKGLENSGWDYRFVSIPLSEYTPGSSYPYNNTVKPSHYHSNYPLNEWLPSFPGALYTDPSFHLLNSLFTPNFIFPAAPDPLHNDGHESGLKNQVDFLQRTAIKNNFLRSDALLAVITLSNGDDRSNGNWVYAGWGPATNKIWQETAASNVANFEASLLNLKGNQPALLKYYSIVAHLNNNCRGYGSRSGLRYERVAADLGGISTDLCSNSVSSSLGSIASQLQIQKLNYVKKYVVIGTEPNVSSIKVTKYYNGTGAGVVIPNDAINGWTYEGYKTNTYTIESPIPMNAQTGYFIELHGNAKLYGSDSAHVEYLNLGSGVSH